MLFSERALPVGCATGAPSRALDLLRCQRTRMLLLENHTTILLVIHGVLALATVGITTHLVLWMRPLMRGQSGRHRSCRRFALLGVGAYAASMLVGMLLYPSYKVRVRAEYLENPSAITRATEAEYRTRALTAKHNRDSLRFRRGQSSLLEDEDLPASGEQAQAIVDEADRRIGKAARVARWFDVKEHWAALGLILSAAIALFFAAAKSSEGQRVVLRLVWAMAILSSLIAWSAAVIGVLTTAVRSVVSL